MMPNVVTDAPTDDFGELPYVVTVQIASRVKSLRKILESGDYAGHVTAARVGVMLYPIDGLDVLSAHRRSGRVTVPCVVADAGSLAEAQLLHVRRSAHGQVNPVAFADAVSFIRTHMDDGPAAGIEYSEYRKIAGLHLDPGIRERASGYIAGLGRRFERIPSFFIALRAISEVEPGLQGNALDKLTKYCDRKAERTKVYAVPDYIKLKKMFATRKLKKASAPRRPKKGDRVPAARHDTTRKGATAVAAANEMPGYCHSASTVRFLCDCGSEYAFSSGDMGIWELKDRNRTAPMHHGDGAPWHAMPEAAVVYLSLYTPSLVYYYQLSGKRHGATILITKRRQPDDAVMRVRRALRPPRGRAA